MMGVLNVSLTGPVPRLSTTDMLGGTPPRQLANVSKVTVPDASSALIVTLLESRLDDTSTGTENEGLLREIGRLAFAQIMESARSTLLILVRVSGVTCTRRCKPDYEHSALYIPYIHAIYMHAGAELGTSWRPACPEPWTSRRRGEANKVQHVRGTASLVTWAHLYGPAVLYTMVCIIDPARDANPFPRSSTMVCHGRIGLTHAVCSSFGINPVSHVVQPKPGMSEIAFEGQNLHPPRPIAPASEVFPTGHALHIIVRQARERTGVCKIRHQTLRRPSL